MGNKRWIQEDKNKDWVICNSVYSAVLAFGIAEFSFFVKLARKPELSGFLNVARNALAVFLIACILVFAAILALAVFCPLCGWIAYNIQKARDRKEGKLP